MRAAALTFRLSQASSTHGVRQNVALAVLICLPLPTLAASGLTIPLPSVIYRIAVGLAEHTRAVVVIDIPGLGAVTADAPEVPRRGAIKLNAAEVAAMAASSRPAPTDSTFRGGDVPSHPRA
ncbi:MAG: hypothetical protein ACRDNB_04910, partial [Gaiellaceae bacterium]